MITEVGLQFTYCFQHPYT